MDSPNEWIRSPIKHTGQICSHSLALTSVGYSIGYDENVLLGILKRLVVKNAKKRLILFSKKVILSRLFDNSMP